MKKLSLEQGSPEWKEWRRNGIGSSDISVIMGSNSFTTPYELWEQFCGFAKEKEANGAMKHGTRCEPKARESLNKENLLELVPLCVEDETISYFQASLDAYDEESRVLYEIKSPISEKVLDDFMYKNVIPSYWMDQIQWQIMIVRPKRAFIAVWDYRVEKCITLEVMPDENRIKEMIQAAEDFWNKVVTGRSPDRQKGDFIEIEDSNLTELLYLYRDCVEKEKSYTALKNETKKKIEEFYTEGDLVCSGFKVYKVEGTTSYDYKQMRMDGVDVDKYKKKSAPYYKIQCP